MANKKAQLEIVANGEDARGEFAKVEQAGVKMADGVEKSQKRIRKANKETIDSSKELAGEQEIRMERVTKAQKAEEEAAKKSAESQKRANSQIIAAIQRNIAEHEAGGKNTAKFYEFQAKQRGADLAAIGPYLADLKRLEQTAGATALSVKELKFATRNLPAQFTDIAVSLQAGQNPLTVFLQQGGQLKDMFGGIGGAARAMGGYVASLVTPLSVGAVAVGGLALAAYQGSRELDGYRTALTNTGHAAGVTAGQLDGMARSINAAGGGTQGAAADALVQLVGTGRVARDILQEAAAASVQYAKASGKGVQDLAKDFQDLAKDPLQATLRLNDGLNYLTRSTYEQIRSLEEQGRKTEAATVAQKAYYDMMNERSPELLAQLGFAEKAWNAVAGAAKGAWDAFLGIGREDTIEQQLERVQKNIQASMQKRNEIGGQSAFAPALDVSIAKLREEEAVLQSTLRELAKGVDLRKQQADQVKAQASWQEIVKANLSDEKKLQLDIDRVRAMGLAAGASQKQIEEVVANLRKKAAKDQKEYSETALAGLIAERQEREKYLASLIANGAAADKVLSSETRVAKIQEELAGKLDKAQRAIKEKELAQARLVAGLDREIELEKARIALEKEGIEANAKVAETAYEAANAAEKQLAEQLASNAAIGVSAEALAAHKNALDLDRAAVLERNAALVLEIGGQDDYAESLKRQAEAIRALAAARADGATKKDDLERAKGDLSEFNKLIDQINQAKLNNIFGPAADGALKLVSALQSVVEMSEATAKALAANEIANAKDPEKMARERMRIEQESVKASINGYATMAGALRGFAKEGSKTYDGLMRAEKAFRAFELASALANAAKKIGLFGAVTTAKVAGDSVMAGSAVAGASIETEASLASGSASAVAGVANQAKGDPYTAFPRMATMAAIMAGLGFVTGFAGGSSGSFAPTNEGTGTVLGDTKAKSESLAKALDLLNSTQDEALLYSKEMLASLRAIEYGIGGVAGLFVRGGGVGAITSGIATGRFDTGLSSALKSINPIVGLFGPAVGGFGDKVINALFGGKTSIQASGIGGAAQTIGQILAGGFVGNTFADVNTKRKIFGVTYSSSNQTVTGELGDELENQITGIFANVGKAVKSAGQILGLDVGKALEEYVVNLGRIDLQGLNGEQIAEKLGAVFGAEADKIAASVVPGFEKLQKVGEGYFETLTRVVTQFETVNVWTKRLGDSLGAVGVEGAIAADALIQAFGGLENYTSLASSFFDNFYTEQERNAIRTQELTEAMAALGFSMPSTIEGFRDLVNAQDLTTEEGRAAYAALLELAGVFYDVTDAARQAAEEQEREAERLREAWASLGDSMRDEVSRIRGLTADAQGQGYEYLAAQFATKTAMARAGDQEAAKALPGLSRAALEAKLAGATSREEYLRIAAMFAASLEQTANMTSGTSGPVLDLPTGSVVDQNQVYVTEGASLEGKIDALLAAIKEMSSDSKTQGTAAVLHMSRMSDILQDVTQNGRAVSVVTNANDVLKVQS